MSTFLGSNFSTSGGSASPTVAFSPNVTAGSLLLLMARFSSTTATITSVTDSQGNTWLPTDALTRSNSASGRMYYAIAGSSGACTVTVALSASVGNTLVVSEIATPFTTLAQHAIAANNNASPNSGAITTNQTAVLVAGISVTPNADAFTPGAGWTERQPGGALTLRAYIADQLDALLGTYSGTATIAAEDWVAAIAAFTLAPGPPGQYSGEQAFGALSFGQYAAIVPMAGGGVSGAALGLAGVQAQATAIRTVSAAPVGRIGARAQAVGTRTVTASAQAQAGARAQTVGAPVGIRTALAQAGARALAIATRTVQAAITGRAGTRAVAAAVRTVAAAILGRTGAQAQATASAARTSAATGRTGARGQAVGSPAGARSVQAQIGARSQCAGSRVVTAQATGQLAARSQCVGVRAVSAAVVGRVGCRTITVGTAARSTAVLARAGARGQAFRQTIPVRDLVYRVGQPGSRWSVGEPSGRWSTGEPGSRWTASELRE